MEWHGEEKLAAERRVGVSVFRPRSRSLTWNHLGGEFYCLLLLGFFSFFWPSMHSWQLRKEMRFGEVMPRIWSRLLVLFSCR